MQDTIWKSLIQRIPESQHSNLMVMTAGRTEINIQMVIRLEEYWFVVRGRLAGTTDMGRIFFVRYDTIDHMGFQKEMTEHQVIALLDGKPMPSAVTPPLEPTAPQPQAAQPQAPQPSAAVSPARAATPLPGTVAPSGIPAAPLPGAGNAIQLPSKSKIIERLKLRTATRATDGQQP